MTDVVVADTLYFGRLPNDTTEDLLYELCSQVGPVKRVSISTKDGKPAGYGFCQFEDVDSSIYGYGLFKDVLKLFGNNVTVGFAKSTSYKVEDLPETSRNLWEDIQALFRHEKAPVNSNGSWNAHAVPTTPASVSNKQPPPRWGSPGAQSSRSMTSPREAQSPYFHSPASSTSYMPSPQWPQSPAPSHSTPGHYPGTGQYQAAAQYQMAPGQSPTMPHAMQGQGTPFTPQQHLHRSHSSPATVLHSHPMSPAQPYGAAAISSPSGHMLMSAGLGAHVGAYSAQGSMMQLNTAAGMAQQGMAQQAMAQQAVAHHGMLQQQGMMQNGMAPGVMVQQQGMAQQGMAQQGMAQQGMAQQAVAYQAWQQNSGGAQHGAVGWYGQPQQQYQQQQWR